MKKIVTSIVICLFVVASALAQTIYPKYIDGHLYFKFKDSYKIDYQVNENTSVDFDQLPKLAPLFEKYGVVQITRPLYIFNDPKLARIIRLKFTDAAAIENFIKELENLPDVEYAEKIPLPHLCVNYNDTYSTGSLLNGAPNQWYLSLINASGAWDLQTGSSSIKLAIVDNAVWGAHEDLNIASSNMCSYATGTAVVGNAAPPTSVSATYNCSTTDISYGNCPAYSWSHGTHCAGLAGATNNNSKGISSLGGGCTLLGVRGADDNGDMYYCYEGVSWAINQGAKVVSMSWGASEYGTSEEQFMQTAYEYGVILVAAAGNEGDEDNLLTYPAAFSSVIGVASIDSDGSLSYFSQHGNGRADIASPGGFYVSGNQYLSNMLSTTYCTCQYWRNYGVTALNGKYYDGMQGTSMACPVAAGLCALMASAYPDITPDQVKQCLINNANPLASGSNTITGNAGYINAAASVQCALDLAGGGGGGGDDPQTNEPGWYGNYDEYGYILQTETGKSIIIRPETYGNYAVGNQITKVKFGTYLHTSLPSYNNNSFTIKIYEGSNVGSTLLSNGSDASISSRMGTLVYTQNYTQPSAGINVVDLTTPYTIGNNTFWIEVVANGPTCFLYDLDNETTVSASSYSADYTLASGHYLYTATTDNTDYLRLNYRAMYTDATQTSVTMGSVEFVLAYYLSDGQPYVESSDLSVELYDANEQVMTSVSLTATQDFVTVPIVTNAGPDLAADDFTITITAGSVEFFNETFDSLNTGSFYLFPSPYSFTITADQLDSAGIYGTFNVCINVTYNGNDPDLSNNSYCVSVTRPQSQSSFTISATANPTNAGTVSGAGSYNSGATAVLTATPNAGYVFQSWKENGNVVSTNATYSFTVTGNRTLVAYFTSQSASNYTITASVNGIGGTITPSGAVTVAAHSNQTFTISSNINYSISSVKVDGTDVTNQLINSSYSFTDVTDNHTIVATFVSEVGINEYGQEAISLYPNPNNGSFTLKINGMDEESVCRIYDVRGAVVDSRLLDAHTEEVNFQTALSAGVYIVKVQSAHRCLTHRLVVR